MTAAGNKERVVMVGASVRSAAQCAARMGYTVYALDQFVDRDLKAVAEVGTLQSLLEIGEGDWSPWGGAPLLLCGGMENRPEAVEVLRSRGCVCGTSPSMLAELRNPANWARWSFSNGILFPPIHGDQDKDSWPQSSESFWLVKSRLGAGGLSVRTWNGEPLHTMEYVQKFIDGVVLGVTFLSQDHTSRVIGCAMSWPVDSFWGPMAFIYRGSVGPVALSSEEWVRLADFANHVKNETGLKGLWQADFVRNREGLWLLEINPRWSSSMELLESAYDISLVAHHLEAVLGEPQMGAQRCDWESHALRVRKDLGWFIGKVVRYASDDFVPNPELLETWWQKRWDGSTEALQEENRLADIPGDICVVPAGYPICTEFAIGSSVDEVRLRLQSTTIPFGNCLTNEKSDAVKRRS